MLILRFLKCFDFSFVELAGVEPASKQETDKVFRPTSLQRLLV
jgi:hypothetical protein